MPKRGQKRVVVNTTIVRKGNRASRNGKRRAPRSPRQPAFGAGGKCTVAYARSLVNPFDYSACIPDGSTGTGVFSCKREFSIATGTGGSCGGLIMYPDVSRSYLLDTANTTAVPVLATSFSSLAVGTQIAGYYSKYRPVSMGLKAFYSGPTQTDGGSIVIAQYSGSQPPEGVIEGSDLSVVCGASQYYKIFPLRNGGQISWRPEDSGDVSQYTGFNDASAFASNEGIHPYIVIYVFGATSAQACLQVEAIWNFEGQFASLEWAPGGYAQKSRDPAEMGWYEAAQRMISGFDTILPSIAASNIGKIAHDLGSSAINSVMNNGIRRMAQYAVNTGTQRLLL